MQNALRIDRIYADNRFFIYIGKILDFLTHQLVLQKENIFLWTPIVFAFGIALYFTIPFEPPISLTIVIFLLSIGIHVFNRGNKQFALLSLICLVFATGFTSAKIRTESVYTPVIDKKISYANIIGTIKNIEKMDEGDDSRIILSGLEIEDIEKPKTPRNIRLRLRKDTNIAIGQKIKVLAGLNPPSDPVIPDGFDFRRHLFFQSIGAVGFIYNEPEIIHSVKPSFINIQDLRHNIVSVLYQTLPADTASVAAALMVGQKNAISEDNKQAIRDAGLAHMLAISGLHVGLFAGTLFFVLRLFMACTPSIALRYPIKKIAAVGALCGAIIYMLLAGATVPTQRAVLMTGVVFLAIILDRSPISLRLVAASALVVLLFRPESLLSVSFQMSFAAVTSLIYFFEVTRTMWTKLYTDSNVIKKLMVYFLAVCMTTIIASIATAPFALYHFGQVSFVGSVANLAAVPLLSFIIMPFALLSLLLMPLGLAFIPIVIMGFGIEAMLDLAYWAAELPHAVVEVAIWPFLSFILIILFCLWIILWKGLGKLIALPFLLFAIFTAQSDIAPDILVSSSHKLFLFRSDNSEVFVSSKRKDKFVLKKWEDTYGIPEKSACILPNSGHNQKKSGPISNHCGEQGCRFVIKGYKVSFLRNPYISKEDCTWADILISTDPVKDRNCNASYIIDKFDTWKSGTHAVWIKSDGVTIKNIAQTNADRPWSKYKTKVN